MMKRHPYSAAFPEMDDTEFETLKRGIQRDGFDPLWPITIYEGQILDGWNRHRACQELEVEPVTRLFEGSATEALAFAVRANGQRRNLGPSQLAFAATELIPLFEEAAKQRRTTNLPGQRPKAPMGAFGKTSELVAEMVGVGARTVERLIKIRKTDPEAAERIRSGDSTVRDEYDRIVAAEKRREKERLRQEAAKLREEAERRKRLAEEEERRRQAEREKRERAERERQESLRKQVEAAKEKSERDRLEREAEERGKRAEQERLQREAEAQRRRDMHLREQERLKKEAEEKERKADSKPAQNNRSFEERLRVAVERLSKDILAFEAVVESLTIEEIGLCPQHTKLAALLMLQAMNALKIKRAVMPGPADLPPGYGETGGI